MINVVEVWLWNTRIGILTQLDNRKAATFEYDKDFLESNIQLAPFMMPLSEQIYYFPELSQESFHGMPGLVADSLPDRFGNAVINQWLARQGRTSESFTALERLCYTGKRGMGALEYVPAIGPADIEQSIDVTQMAEFASEILSKRENAMTTESDINLAQMIEIGSSAGGARAKAVIAWNKETGEVKSRQADAGKGYEYYLLKFDGVQGNGDHEVADSKQYTLIEYAYYQMATDVGIKMNPCSIFKKDGLNHFLTQRFDRRNGEKLHMQSFAALSHSDFNSPGSSSYEMLADYTQKLGGGMEEIKQIYRRMVFNVVGMNCDDHVKNFSFLMDRRGNWSLAPAYDVTFAYAPSNRWLSGHQMTVAGKTFQIIEEDLLQSGKTMGLNVKSCKRIINDSKEVLSNWREYAEKNHISDENIMKIAKGISLAGFVEL